MKILHLPNERTNERTKLELTSRVAFEEFYNKGRILDYQVYSFLLRLKETGSNKAVQEEILNKVKEQKPDIIFWQHISEFDLSEDFYKTLKQCSPHTKIVYQDMDAYGHFVKKVTPQMRKILSIAEIVFTCGTGDFFNVLKENGAQKVFYQPHSFDQERAPIDLGIYPGMGKKYPLLMIGSRAFTRNPLLTFPGSKERLELVNRFTKEFTSDFYLFGHNWKKSVSYQGSLPFHLQYETIQQSRVTVNWDHFDNEPNYFSDRLPISLICGIPHITTKHPGYGYQFKDCEGGLYCAESPKEAVEIARYLLSKPDDFLYKEGIKGRNFALNTFNSIYVYSTVLEIIQRELNV